MADKIALMSLGELLQYGSPMDLYRSPNCAEVAEFFGSVNWLPGRRVEADLVETRIGRFRTSGDAGASTDVFVGFRPECIQYAEPATDKGDNTFEARLTSSVFLGDQFVYDATAGDVQLTGKSRTVPTTHGDTLSLRVMPDEVMVFAADEKNTAFVNSVGKQA